MGRPRNSRPQLTRDSLGRTYASIDTPNIAGLNDHRSGLSLACAASEAGDRRNRV